MIPIRIRKYIYKYKYIYRLIYRFLQHLLSFTRLGHVEKVVRNFKRQNYKYFKP